MRVFGWVLVALAAVCLLVAMGPRRVATEPDRAAIDASVPHDPATLDAWLAHREATAGDLTPGTEASLRWHGAPGSHADVAIVVLHGFSATRQELAPLPDQLADDLGAHVVYTRLSGHGLDGPAMTRHTAGTWLADAERAYDVATRIADRVVLLTSSTGGTVGLWLQVRHRGDPRLAGAVHLSPNLGLRAQAAEATRLPWLGPIITTVATEHCFQTISEDHARYWTSCYPTTAVLELVALIDHVRNLPLEDARQPTLVVWSGEDGAVDPAHTEALVQRLPDVTPLRWDPEPGESNHVLAGDILAPEGTKRLKGPILDAMRGMVE